MNDMRDSPKTIKLTQLRDWLVRWARMIIVFFVSQATAQAAGFAAGLILVNKLPVHEYAVLGLSLSTLSMIAVGSDLGLVGALAYFWREYSRDPSAQARRIQIILALRRTFYASMLGIGAALYFTSPLIRAEGVAISVVCFIIIAITAWFQLQNSLRITMMRVVGNLNNSYVCDVAGSTGRLLAATVVVVPAFTTAPFGLLAGLLGAMTSAWLANRFTTLPSAALVDDARAWKDVLRYLLPVGATCILSIISDPLVMWAASTRTNPTHLAEAFAVGRIGQVFSIFSGFIMIVVGHKFVSTTDERALTKLAAKVFSLFFCLNSVVIAIAMMLPTAPLLLIGPQYAHLKDVVALALLPPALGLLNTLLTISNRVRGWVRLEPLLALIQAVAALAAISQWRFTDASSIIMLFALISLMNITATAFTSVVGHFNSDRVKINAR